MSIVTSLMTSPLLAQAGSGSSGFSGGSSGGSSGGGFSSGGGSSSGSGSPAVVILLIVIGFAVAGTLMFLQARKIRQAREARAARDTEARAGAAVAAEDDAAFDADALTATAAELFADVQTAWDARDEDALRRLIGGDLLEEWIRRLADFAAKRWHNRVVLKGPPEIRLITLINRHDDEDDRVVFHVEQRMDAWVDTPKGKQYANDRTSPATVLSEYWTMAKHEGGWRLVSIEGDAEGAHHLTTPMVLDPADDPELAATSRTELAVGDAAEGSVAGLVSTGLHDDAQAAALDLALVDDRWSPDVLRIAVDRAIAAWATAVDGPDDDLERLAEPDAVRALLHGSDTSGKTRTVVRGPRVQEATIVRVADEGEGGTMDVELRYRARWYREDRDTAAVLQGDRDAERELRAAWTFALTDDAADPWRLVAAGD